MKKSYDIDLKKYERRGNAFYCTHTQLKEIANKVITPELEDKGFIYDSKYSWYSTWDNHMRKIVRASLMTGYAILSWGVGFDFLPVLSQNRIVYEKTDNKIKMHLYTYPQSFIDMKQWKEHHLGMFGADLKDIEYQTAKAFLLAATGSSDEGERLLTDYFLRMPDTYQDKIVQKAFMRLREIPKVIQE